MSLRTERKVIDMRKVNVEVIRKELYTNLSEMYFGEVSHMRELSKVYFKECETNKYKVKTLYDVLEIKIKKPFSNFEHTIYITLDEEGVYCFSVNTDNKCYDYQWYAGYSDCKNKTVLYMEVIKKLTRLLLLLN